MPIIPALQLSGKPYVSGFLCHFIHSHFHERILRKAGTELASGAIGEWWTCSNGTLASQCFHLAQRFLVGQIGGLNLAVAQQSIIVFII